jgi:hypothetical protein
MVKKIDLGLIRFLIWLAFHRFVVKVYTHDFGLP